MAKPIDINGLRSLFHINQNNGDTLPAKTERQVFVDRSGHIMRGSDASDIDDPELSQVHQGIFAALLDDPRQLELDRAVASRALPRTTREVIQKNITGWLYTFRTSQGMDFACYTRRDPETGSYQTWCIKPELEVMGLGAHGGHLYDDGRICYGWDNDSGMPSLESAYAKAVVWANERVAMMAAKERGEPAAFSLNADD
ncbi:MAG: hypothetical protein EA401_01250 [Planctomycetota bacterium]|nr:MAG: hypothetical protein EA401_01250 [Planctomycetota bacterium]